MEQVKTLHQLEVLRYGLVNLKAWLQSTATGDPTLVDAFYEIAAKVANFLGDNNLEGRLLDRSLREDALIDERETLYRAIPDYQRTLEHALLVTGTLLKTVTEMTGAELRAVLRSAD